MNAAEPTAIAVTGGAGALGVHFVRHVLERTTLPVRALVHRTPLAADLQTPRVLQVRGSVLDAATLDAWLLPGAAVVHLAWTPSFTAADHARSTAMLADAAARHGVVRFVHCSTAVVAGGTRAAVVDEETPCAPVTEYERSKLEIEAALTAASSARFRLAILRPTAIFGPGLQNLDSLIESLRRGSALVNYARGCLFGHRPLHLVPVQTVASALLFLAHGQDGAPPGTVTRFIVSEDHDPAGRFRAVEARIRRALGIAPALPPVPVPSVVLAALLRLAGRPDANPRRIYDGSRLRGAGFVAPVQLGDAIDAYLRWYCTVHERATA